MTGFIPPRDRSFDLLSSSPLEFAQYLAPYIAGLERIGGLKYSLQCSFDDVIYLLPDICFYSLLTVLPDMRQLVFRTIRLGPQVAPVIGRILDPPRALLIDTQLLLVAIPLHRPV